MNRLDNLPEDSLVERVNRIVKNAEELKTTAQRFSSDSVLFYKAFSNNAYDMSITNIHWNDKVIDMSFTPDDLTTVNLGGVLSLTITGGISPGYSVGTYVEGLIPEGGVTRWRMYLSGSDALPVPLLQLKFHIHTNAPGTFSATLL